ncbi:ubiquitin-associated domain-containing protein 2 isoform X5 [Gallus gallus]|nr:ubiquitin-associated domain-containing protein 2 isoform X5 [Gallus gallus]
MNCCIYLCWMFHLMDFNKAPLSKSLLLVPSAISILLTLLFQHYQKFFAYNLQAIKEDFQIWRLVCGRVICLDLKDTFCSSLLIYNFRIFERRYGSRKFSSFLLGAWTLSALFDLLLVEAAQYVFGITINSLPSGFLGPVFALFVPFYCSIPRVQVTQVLGYFSITNKTLVYILGLQLLTSGSYIWILALSGLISGICYNSSILKVHRILCVPSWVAKIFSWTLEPIFSSAEPTNEIRVGMGATVDIQRQQRMELLDRQIMMSQVAQMRRQRQQQLSIIFQLNYCITAVLKSASEARLRCSSWISKEITDQASEKTTCGFVNFCDTRAPLGECRHQSSGYSK